MQMRDRSILTSNRSLSQPEAGYLRVSFGDAMQMRLDDACGYLWVSFRQGHESIRSANRSLRPTAAVRNATTRSKSVIFSFGHRVSFFGAPPEARPSCFSSSFSFYFWGVQSIERENEKAFPYFPFFFFFLAQADPFFFGKGGPPFWDNPFICFPFFLRPTAGWVVIHRNHRSSTLTNRRRPKITNRRTKKH